MNTLVGQVLYLYLYSKNYITPRILQTQIIFLPKITEKEMKNYNLGKSFFPLWIKNLYSFLYFCKKEKKIVVSAKNRIELLLFYQPFPSSCSTSSLYINYIYSFDIQPLLIPIYSAVVYTVYSYDDDDI